MAVLLRDQFLQDTSKSSRRRCKQTHAVQLAPIKQTTFLRDRYTLCEKNIFLLFYSLQLVTALIEHMIGSTCTKTYCTTPLFENRF